MSPTINDLFGSPKGSLKPSYRLALPGSAIVFGSGLLSIRRVSRGENLTGACTRMKLLTIIATQIVSVLRYISISMQKTLSLSYYLFNSDFPNTAYLICRFCIPREFLRKYFPFFLAVYKIRQFFLRWRTSLRRSFSLTVPWLNCNLPVLATFSHIGNGICALCKFPHSRSIGMQRCYFCLSLWPTDGVSFFNGLRWHFHESSSRARSFEGDANGRIGTVGRTENKVDRRREPRCMNTVPLTRGGPGERERNF